MRGPETTPGFVDLRDCEEALQTRGTQEILDEPGEGKDDRSLLTTGLALVQSWQLPALRRLCDSDVVRTSTDPSIRALVIWSRSPNGDANARSVAELRSIVVAHPSLPLPRLLLGGAILVSQPKEAIRLIQEVFEERPDSCLARYFLCVALVRLKRAEDALGVIDGAPGCARHIGWLHVEMLAAFLSRDFERASRAYRARNAAAGWRCLEWAPSVWPRLQAILLLLGCVVAVGVVTATPALVAVGTALWIGCLPVSWHMLRSRRAIAVGLAAAIVISLLAWWATTASP